MELVLGLALVVHLVSKLGNPTDEAGLALGLALVALVVLVGAGALVARAGLRRVLGCGGPGLHGYWDASVPVW